MKMIIPTTAKNWNPTV